MKHYQKARREEKRAGAALIKDVEREVGVVRKQRSKYSDVCVEEALLAVIMAGGIVKHGAAIVGVSESTVREWMQLHAARYAELRREKGPELERRAVDGLMAFVTAAEEVKQLALEKTSKQLSDGEAKDPGATLRNIATAQGISVTKIMELTGRPTSTAVGRSPNELLSALARLGAIVNSTAEEVPPQAALSSGDEHSTVATAEIVDSTEAGDTT